MTMRERPQKIRVGARHAVYGMLSGAAKMPLVIFVHGFPGSMDDDLMVNACRWFSAQGFATFRYDQYGIRRDARQVMECALSTFAGDLDSVVGYFRRRGRRRIFIVGHSFGGPIIFSTQKRDFDGVALWDPSFKLSFLSLAPSAKPPRYVRQMRAYVMRWGTNVVIGKTLVDDVEAFPWETVSGRFGLPFVMLTAGKGVLRSGKRYLTCAHPKSERSVIADADHDFAGEHVRRKLFVRTRAWFQKIRNEKRR